MDKVINFPRHLGLSKNMLTSLCLTASAFSGSAPAARVTRSTASVRMNVDLTEQFGYDLETGGPWDPLKYSEKSGTPAAAAARVVRAPRGALRACRQRGRARGRA
jgi:hypothetical protein